MGRSLFCILIIACLSACSGNNANNKDLGDSDTAISTREGVKRLYDFAVYKDDFGIPLKGWAHELQLEKNIGPPLNTSISQLGPGADTHMESYIKQLHYPNLRIQLFAPNTPDTAWIMKMIVTGDGYTTARGIKTGMDTSKILELYPEAVKWPDGKKDQSGTPYYISNESDQLYLRFYVSSGRVDSIEMYHDLP